MSMVDVFRSLGRSDALKLRQEAYGMTETEIIEREHSAPAFNPEKDYSGWAVKSPVVDDGQVWLLLQPYNAKNHSGRPADIRAIWGLAHTKNPKRAKPWVAPLGTSGMYMQGECYKDENGKIYRAKNDNTVMDAEAYPAGWEVAE